MSRQYRRYYIDLESKRSKVGRCKVEIEGEKEKIYIWVQNVSREVYDIYIMETRENKTELIGELKTDFRGYGEFEKTIPEGNTIRLGEADVIILTYHDKKDRIVMRGFKGGEEKGWQEEFLAGTKIEIKGETETQGKDSEVQKEIEEVEKEEEIEELEKVIEKAEEIEKVKEDKNGEVDKVEELKDDKSVSEEIKKEESEKKEKLGALFKTVNNYKVVTADQIDELYFGMQAQKNGIDELYAGAEFPTPFAREKEEMEWRKVTLKELVKLPLVHFEKFVNNPYIIWTYYKNGHMLLGRYKQKKMSYILALPDEYCPKYKNLMQHLGFIQFKSCEDKISTEGDKGYWLMPIDIV